MLPFGRGVLDGRRASSLGPWNWLDQLRFRFDLAIEVLDPDLSYVLNPAPALGRAPDIRAAMLDHEQLRLTAISVIRLAKARSLTAGDLRIRIFPVLSGRQPAGLLLVADVAAAGLEASEPEEQIDRRLDAAGQWLTAAIEGMACASAARFEEAPSPRRVDALIDVVEVFHHVDDARQLIELTVEAVALWYDADVRAYRQDLSGTFVLDTWLPGIDLSRVPLELSENAAWERDQVFRLESFRDLEKAGWDVRSGETLFVPIAIDDRVRWLITVTGGGDDGIGDMLEFFRRFDGLLLSSLERDAEEALRRRLVDQLCLDDAPFDATIQLGVEVSSMGIGATAGRLEVFYGANAVAALSSTWGSFARDAAGIPGEEMATARQMTMRAAIGAHVMAVFTFQKEGGAFSSGDARLARAAVTAFANWLSGTFRSHADFLDPGSATRSLDFAGKLGADVEHARRENRGGALVVVRPRGPALRGAGLNDVAQVLEHHVRDSDTVGVMADAAAALLRELPVEMIGVVTDRLLSAARERDIDIQVSILSLALSSESSEALVNRALSSTQDARVVVSDGS